MKLEALTTCHWLGLDYGAMLNVVCLSIFLRMIYFYGMMPVIGL